MTPILMHTENVECHFRIVFVAEGFKTSEMSTFDTKAQDAMDAILALEPFASNDNKINFYKAQTASVDSGISTISHPVNVVTPITKDTAWDVYNNRMGGTHFLGMTSAKRDDLEDDLKDFAGGNKVFVIVICNDPHWAGGAEFVNLAQYDHTDYNTAVCIVSKGRPASEATDFDFLVVHEFGHSFGDLDDEYVDSWYATNAPTYENATWIYPNRLNIKDTDQTPSLTCGDAGAWCEGGRYVTTGKWRSSSDCLMRSSTPSAFSTRNQGLLEDRINDEATLCPSPGNQTFTMSPIGRTTASAACNDTPSVTKYGRPVNGQVIYDDTFKTIPFNGSGLYYKTSYKNTRCQISSTGVVSNAAIC